MRSSTAVTVSDSVTQYLRIPASQHAMIREIAGALGIPMQRVIAAMFHFLFQPPAADEAWGQVLEILRAAASGLARVTMFDLDESDFYARRQNYELLARMGLIEDFDWKHARDARRILCTFKVSEMGRVIAELFKQSGLSADITEEEERFIEEGNHEEAATA
jgi:hypothetical protein